MCLVLFLLSCVLGCVCVCSFLPSVLWVAPSAGTVRSSGALDVARGRRGFHPERGTFAYAPQLLTVNREPSFLVLFSSRCMYPNS